MMITMDYGALHAFTTCISAVSTNINKNKNKHPFNGPLSGTTQVSRYQKGKINLDSEWQWHQLGHHSDFYRPDAQPTASTH